MKRLIKVEYVGERRLIQVPWNSLRIYHRGDWTVLPSLPEPLPKKPMTKPIKVVVDDEEKPEPPEIDPDSLRSKKWRSSLQLGAGMSFHTLKQQLLTNEASSIVYASMKSGSLFAVVHIPISHRFYLKGFYDRITGAYAEGNGFVPEKNEYHWITRSGIIEFFPRSGRGHTYGYFSHWHFDLGLSHMNLPLASPLEGLSDKFVYPSEGHLLLVTMGLGNSIEVGSHGLISAGLWYSYPIQVDEFDKINMKLSLLARGQIDYKIYRNSFLFLNGNVQYISTQIENRPLGTLQQWDTTYFYAAANFGFGVAW